MTKYRSQRTCVDGIWFASKGEARRYTELSLLQRAGEIRDLKLQVPFELFPFRKDDTGKWPAVKYVADFTYKDVRTGEFIVEDYKGLKTDVYKLKKRMLLEKYAISIHEVTKDERNI